MGRFYGHFAPTPIVLLEERRALIPPPLAASPFRVRLGGICAAESTEHWAGRLLSVCHTGRTTSLRLSRASGFVGCEPMRPQSRWDVVKRHVQTYGIGSGTAIGISRACARTNKISWSGLKRIYIHLGVDEMRPGVKLAGRRFGSCANLRICQSSMQASGHQSGNLGWRYESIQYCQLRISRRTCCPF
jgi:hypothetical protein